MARVKNLPKGSKNHRAKLTEDQIGVIRGMIELHCPDRIIAQMYGVSRKAIYDIRRGRSWTHVPIVRC